MGFSEIKYAVNSTLGTDGFQSLDALLLNRIYAMSPLAKRQVFIKNGSFTVPEGVRTIYVTACGGGGAGGRSDGAGILTGPAGTATVLSGIVTLPGGLGGGGNANGTGTGGKAGGPGGGDGGGASTSIGVDGTAGIAGYGGTGSRGATNRFGGGGGGSLGGGGAFGDDSGNIKALSGGASLFRDGGDYPVGNGAFGGGGGGKCGNNATWTAGGGGGGDAILGKAFAVEPGQVIDITVGRGGAIFTSGKTNSGGDGIVIIEW